MRRRIVRCRYDVLDRNGECHYIYVNGRKDGENAEDFGGWGGIEYSF